MQQKHIDQLIGQHPAIAEILKERRQKKANEGQITIKVQKADHDFLFQFGCNYTGSNGCVCRIKNGEHEGEKARQRDILHYIGHDGSVLSKFLYEQAEGRSRMSVREIIGMPGLLDKISAFIWLSVYHWYKPSTEGQEADGLHYGEYLRTELYFTVYTEPKKGWQHLLDSVDYLSNVTLHNDLIRYGVLQRDVNWEHVSEELQKLANKFQNQVYLTGMRQLVDATQTRGLSGQFGKVQLMSYVLAGRIQFTLQEGDNQFTIIGVEGKDDPRMGYNSICATYPKAKELVETVIDIWQRTPSTSRSELFNPDEKVNIGF